MLDRYILSLLAQPIITEFRISDEQIGLLIGAGFAILYSLVGLPAAHFIDRSKRIPIVVAGVMIWSFSTMAAAFSTGFWTLALTRAGVAIGEAVLTPAAISIIADLFPKEKRGPPVAVYSITAAVMGTGAAALGGFVLYMATDIAPSWGLTPWRMTMLLVGAPGVVFGLILGLTTREPPRTLEASEAPGNDDELGIKAFLTELVKGRRLFFPFYLGVSAVALYVFGLASWAPTILIRSYALETSSAGYLLGSIGVPCAIAGAAVWPFSAAFLGRRGWPGALPATMVISAILMAPIMVAAPFAGSALAFAICVGAAKLINSTSTLSPMVIQNYGSGRMRGRLTALYVLVSSVFGLSGGSFLVPVFARLWPGDNDGLLYGLGMLGGLAALVAIPSFWFAYRVAASMAATEKS